MTTTFGIWILAYLIGSIPFGVLLARARRVDLRRHGSGNIGATNVARTLGPGAGLFTLLGDALKGVLAVWLAERVLGSPAGVAGAGVFAFLGHVFSVFLKFRGGKGVATGLGVFAWLTPGATLCAAGVFALCLAAFRYVSISSMVSALSLPVWGLVWQAPREYVTTAALVALLVVVRHTDNIRRLRAGTESKFAIK